jgi:hypothetical protein
MNLKLSWGVFMAMKVLPWAEFATTRIPGGWRKAMANQGEMEMPEDCGRSSKYACSSGWAFRVQSGTTLVLQGGPDHTLVPKQQ